MRASHLIWLAAAIGCGGTEGAATVTLPVTTRSEPLPTAATDLGYEVRIHQIRIAVSGIQFTTMGEMHAAAPPPGTAYHPGHSAGGEVTGELPGDFVLLWNGQSQPKLGDGTLIVGAYTGANFVFRAADAQDGLPAGDPLLGHTFHLTGTASRGGMTRPFDAVLDVEADAQVIGATFVDEVTERSAETLAITFFPVDPTEADTAYDGVDFFTLPRAPSGEIQIRPGSAAANVLRRTLQTHDHYGVLPQ